jgi:hypothetical protein
MVDIVTQQEFVVCSAPILLGSTIEIVFESLIEQCPFLYKSAHNGSEYINHK